MRIFALINILVVSNKILLIWEESNKNLLLEVTRIALMRLIGKVCKIYEVCKGENMQKYFNYLAEEYAEYEHETLRS